MTIQTSAPVLTDRGSDPFQSDVERVARRLLGSVPDLTQHERDFLYAVTRSSYGFKALRRLAEIAARAVALGDSVALADAVRGQIVRERSLHVREVESEIAIYIEETRAQSLADVAQAASLVNPSPANRESALHHLGAHAAWIQRAIDVLHVHAATPRALVLLPRDI
jgi:hypothetical protein